MKKIDKKSLRKAGVIVGISLGIACMVFFANVDDGVMQHPEQIERSMKWRTINLPFLGDNDPGTGASGVLMVYINATNTSNPAVGTEYNANLTTAYATGETNNTSISSDIPHSTSFDVIVKVRWNATHAYDTAWNLSLVRAYANCSDLSVTAIQMNESQIADSANYLYVNYYLHDSDGGAGTGFTITEGQSVSSFSVNFESKFYP